MSELPIFDIPPSLSFPPLEWGLGVNPNQAAKWRPERNPWGSGTRALTAAAVIASQALISGPFSLTMQAVQMGYVPFINIRHTSYEKHGQIYIP